MVYSPNINGIRVEVPQPTSEEVERAERRAKEEELAKQMQQNLNDFVDTSVKVGQAAAPVLVDFALTVVVAAPGMQPYQPWTGTLALAIRDPLTQSAQTSSAILGESSKQTCIPPAANYSAKILSSW